VDLAVSHPEVPMIENAEASIISNELKSEIAGAEMPVIENAA
jgi:hypothetical protein